MVQSDIITSDCLEAMRDMPDQSVDLVFGSPPYESARSYGIGFDLRGQAWVDWMVERWREMQRISRGLVAMVVDGQTRQYRYSAAPILLMADLHRAGFKLRKPPLYVRHGIPGSGGPDWLKNRYEFIACTSSGKLPWSDNVACGHEPKKCGAVATYRACNGKRQNKTFKTPTKANPGNLIDCGANAHFGLGNENEAPFPEKLAEFFVKSFCPPDGNVLDPFCGSGTTLAVANRLGRNAIGIDIRDCQADLTRRRLSEQRELLAKP